MKSVPWKSVQIMTGKCEHYLDTTLATCSDIQSIQVSAANIAAASRVPTLSRLGIVDAILLLRRFHFTTGNTDAI